MIAKQKLPKHVQNYFEAFGYTVADTILCELCGKPSNEIHHIVPRSRFGSKNAEQKDSPDNLVALCVKCHQDAHGPASRDIRQQLKEIISKRK